MISIYIYKQKYYVLFRVRFEQDDLLSSKFSLKCVKL